MKQNYSNVVDCFCVLFAILNLLSRDDAWPRVVWDFASEFLDQLFVARLLHCSCVEEDCALVSLSCIVNEGLSAIDTTSEVVCRFHPVVSKLDTVQRTNSKAKCCIGSLDTDGIG